MEHSSSVLQQSEPLWRLFYRPMFAISLVLHAFVLMVPFPSEPEPVAESEVEETVNLASLAALNRPAPTPPPQASPLPSPIPPPTPQATPAPVTAIAPLPAPLLPNPVSNPNPEPSPEASPTETTATVSDPVPELTPDPVVEEPFADFFAQFQGNLQGLGSVEGLGIPVEFFAEPEAFFAADSLQRGSEPEPLAGNENVLWFSLKRPAQVYDQLQQVFADYTFSPIGNYGGGDLYEATQGDRTFYLSLVPGNSSINTFAVFWSRDPNQPIEATATPVADPSGAAN
ncbi:hypothetical protein IQ268_10850 [Oculatella sp. LEGE 06141]|nr:hypothetical protein [Oculatella sp. LEGE 06141]